MTHDDVEIVLKVRTSMFTGGLFQDPGPGLVPTDPKDWAPSSDSGYTAKTAEVQAKELIGTKWYKANRNKVGFWEWLMGRYDMSNITVSEIVSVKTLSKSYVSGK